jgi:hypothetical protein
VDVVVVSRKEPPFSRHRPDEDNCRYCYIIMPMPRLSSRRQVVVVVVV